MLLSLQQDENDSEFVDKSVMGISGLLPFLERATRTCNISEFRGATVAVDSYCWLHKGATACAEALARGDETDVSYVNYCMKYVHMLKRFDLKPIMVFDGNRLPAKETTERKRRDIRKNAKVRAVELLRLGKKDEAYNYFRQCVDITPAMAHRLIEECRRNQVDCIVAPYEADSQLAFLNVNGFAEVIITEDSDLVLFGCSKVFFKLDINGNGRLVEKDKIPLCMNMKPDCYTFDKFRYTCILSGCDYLDSLPGIGLKKALKFFQLTAENDPAKFLDKVPRYLNLRREMSEEYKRGFLLADATFRHQIVFDPRTKKLVRLTDPSIDGTNPEFCENAGNFCDDDLAYQIALGNVDPSTRAKYPQQWSPPKSSLSSIWSECYVQRTPRKHQKELVGRRRTNDAQVLVNDALDDVIEDREKLSRLEFFRNQIDDACDNKEQHARQDDKRSPVLIRKRFVNPFLKKNRRSSSPPLDMSNNAVVLSKYFHNDMKENHNLDETVRLCDDDSGKEVNVTRENEMTIDDDDDRGTKKRKIEVNDESKTNNVKRTTSEAKAPSLPEPQKSRIRRSQLSQAERTNKTKNQRPIDSFFVKLLKP